MRTTGRALRGAALVTVAAALIVLSAILIVHYATAPNPRASRALHMLRSVNRTIVTVWRAV